MNSPVDSLPPEVRAFDHAQGLSIQLMRAVVDSLEAGMSEADICDLARQQAQGFGFSHWFHPPEIRLQGRHSRFYRPRKKRTLSVGDLVEIDLGPATDDAFGDVGVGLAFGVAEEPVAVQQARDTCRAVCGFASSYKTVGELFVFSQAWAVNRRFTLGKVSAIGHSCPLPQGPLGTAWPKAARAAISLRRFQVHRLNPRRLQGIWALSPNVLIDGKNICFEEMVFIDGEIKRVLGRDSLDQVGTY
jgi:hypothetical protein